MRSPLLAEQFTSLERQEQATRLGMWTFLGSETLFFGVIFTLYASYRAMYPNDFALAIEHNTAAYGSLNTFLLLTSSFTVAMAVGEVRRDRIRRAIAYLVATLVLGAGFLVVKGLEYAIHIHEGSLPTIWYHLEAAPTLGARMFYTIYWLGTGLHALHVTGGLIALSWLSHRTAQGAYTSGWHGHLEMGALYWHLVDIIWIFLWPMLYLMR